MKENQFIKGGDFMEQKQHRKNMERRVVIERRLVNDPTFYGPQRRKILDRRCGIDRRQIF